MWLWYQLWWSIEPNLPINHRHISMLWIFQSMIMQVSFITLSHWNIFDIIFPKRKQGNHATYLPSIPKPGYVPAPNTAEYDDFSTSHLNASSVSAVPLNYLQVDSLPSSNLILSTEGTASSRQSQGVPFYQSFINFVDENQFRVQKYCGLLFVLLFGFIFIIVLITIIRGLIRSDEPFSQLEDEA